MFQTDECKIFDNIRVAAKKSLDELDNESFKAGNAPFASKYEFIDLIKGNCIHPTEAFTLVLDGEWQMVEEDDEKQRLNSIWEDALRAIVPGSIHTALVETGRIPDPTFGTNQKIAKLESFKTWWMKKTFTHQAGMKNLKLIFGGICNKCTIWLNGKFLGSHEGMFGGPEYDITEYLEDENTLIVKLFAIPFIPTKENDINPDDNDSWRYTVVFNNVYGWHYSNVPSLGIWRTVKLTEKPEVSMPHPFITTKRAKEGVMGLTINLTGNKITWAGIIKCTIQPENFEGESYNFVKTIQSNNTEKRLNLEFKIPNPQLWWPVDLGEPNLYKMIISFVPDNGGIPDYKEFTFGIRTVEMFPLPGGPQPDKFNWTFVINGEPHFIKGTGWCTADALMDFSYTRLHRFISLAGTQHVQMLRAWGSGMPETDEFYDICNRQGIMVIQEWPTAWDSHNTQPYDMLEETVRLNTLRLRNHPSLVIWGGGNESSGEYGSPFGAAIDMMGRLSIELDGTRIFHRGSPFGGSDHNYSCYWGRKHLDYNLEMISNFFGEFGLACMPVYESVQKYLPDDEKHLWPPKEDGAFSYHTPKFNTSECLSRLNQYSKYFVSEDCTMEEFIIGSQLSQSVGVRHTLERARTRWPNCTGALYYKMNDNFPAASWACVDWYGAPKIGYYVFQDAFAPLHACVLFSKLNFEGTPDLTPPPHISEATEDSQKLPMTDSLFLPVFLLDDADALKDVAWKVIVRAYDSSLKEIKRADFNGENSIVSPNNLGYFELSYEETHSTPLLVVTEIVKDGCICDRTFYWTNYEAKKGCLFTLPETQLHWIVSEYKVSVRNLGNLPAVAVNVSCPGQLDKFTVSDNYFWLNAGEEKTVEVNITDNITVSAWNCKL